MKKIASVVVVVAVLLPCAAGASDVRIVLPGVAAALAAACDTLAASRDDGPAGSVLAGLCAVLAPSPGPSSEPGMTVKGGPEVSPIGSDGGSLVDELDPRVAASDTAPAVPRER